MLEGRGERAPTPFYYFSLRIPFGDQRPANGAVRDGRWKLKLAQSGWYPEIFEPIARTELYSHPQILFDLEADSGERRNVSAERPDVVERLSAEIARFEAALAPAPPVLTTAAPYDHTGWDRPWRGIGMVAGIYAAVAGMLVVGAVVLFRRWRRRRRRT